ncbi:MAG: ribosome biogenesis GTPase Der [Candidatus Komeilibacteria bacterium]|nr:ribosome biogenesis GTPase Der [Candidatus Komeilibacteria bacterium]
MTKQIKVAIVGRANTGKSTLFNRLTEEKKAIVSNIPGTTRDRNYGQVLWRGETFILIDTGGVDLVHEKELEKEVVKQAHFAISEADVILFMVDAKLGVTAQDKTVANILRKQTKPVLVVANKADNAGLKKQLADFYQFGLGEAFAVSAISGSGTGDLLDEVYKIFKTLKRKGKSKIAETIKPIKIAIIGKPNVGKSSLVNAILGEERVIVSPMPYTTRDSQDIYLNYRGQPYILIDTAGIRRQGHIQNKLEKSSVAQALSRIAKADVTVLVTDAAEKLSKQDAHLADVILSSQASLIILANKWDLIGDKTDETINKFTKYYKRFFPFLSFAPVIFISALEKQRVNKVLETAKTAYEERFREITDNAMDKFLKKLLATQPPARGKGTKQPRIYGLKQTGTNPPCFEILKDFQSDLHFSYFRFIENRLREHFGFFGTPIIIKVRKLGI